MQKKLRGLDELEKRVAKLEQELGARSGQKPTAAAGKPSSASRATAKKPATPKKPPA
jgi:hypothetical protein